MATDDKTSEASESAEQPATPELVEITIDGEAVKVPKGKNLLEALLDAGEEMSYFCYHPGLSVVAKCRQCLIGLGDGYKLVPACQLTAADGMQIRSKTEQVQDARRALLEYTLVNHPVDCVICDKAGECALQRMYMDWDAAPSLVNHEKVDKPKRVDIGPDIVLDAERCILCDRCIRFCSEVAGTPQLTFSYRGNHTVLTTAPGERLDNPYALNTVDICPVGALTDKDFRFKSRVWDLFATRSTCTGCARGCPLEIHHKNNRIYRLVPPKRWDMNLNWMCDFGRRTYKAIRDEERVVYPVVEGKQVDLQQAVTRAVAGMEGPLDGERQQIGVVIGAGVTNEDAWIAARFGGDFLGARLFVAAAADSGAGDEILRRDDANANRAGVTAITGDDAGDVEQLAAALDDGSITALYVVGDELDGQLGEAALAKLAELEVLVVQATRPSPITERAQVVLPAAMWAELDGTITNFEGKVQRLRPAVEPPGYARPHWDLLRRVARACGWRVKQGSAGELFAQLVAQVATFADASWGEEIPTTELRFAGRRG